VPTFWKNCLCTRRIARHFDHALTFFTGAFFLSVFPAQAQEPARTQSDHSGQQQNDVADDQPVITLPAGSVIEVRVADSVDSKHGQTGELLTGSVDPSVLVDNAVVIPRGTEAHIRLADEKKGGHIKGKAKITLELVSLIINGEQLRVRTNPETKSQGAADAKGSALKKRAQSGGSSLPGEPVTAAAGPVIAVFTAANAEVKAGSRIQFRLERPFTFEKPPVVASQPSN
jgi:hypothetical protein